MKRRDEMTCREAFERLDDYLDRELGADETELVGEHLEQCALCAREFVFEEAVVQDLREKLRRISAPEDLMSRIAERLSGEEPPA